MSTDKNSKRVGSPYQVSMQHTGVYMLLVNTLSHKDMHVVMATHTTSSQTILRKKARFTTVGLLTTATVALD